MNNACRQRNTLYHLAIEAAPHGDAPTTDLERSIGPLLGLYSSKSLSTKSGSVDIRMSQFCHNPLCDLWHVPTLVND